MRRRDQMAVTLLPVVALWIRATVAEGLDGNVQKFLDFGTPWERKLIAAALGVPEAELTSRKYLCAGAYDGATGATSGTGGSAGGGVAS